MKKNAVFLDPISGAGVKMHVYQAEEIMGGASGDSEVGGTVKNG